MKINALITNELRATQLDQKLATRIRNMFHLTKEDDVKKYVVRKDNQDGKVKAPKIQRLITPERIKRKKTETEG